MSTRSSRFQEPLRLELKASQRLRGALAALAILALGAIACAAIPAALQLILAALLLSHLSFLLYRHARSTGCLQWRGEYWSWVDGTGIERTLLLQRAAVWPGLIVLRFRDQANGRTRIFTLLADSFASEMQRRLRVYLRFMPVFERREFKGGESDRPGSPAD